MFEISRLPNDLASNHIPESIYGWVEGSSSYLFYNQVLYVSLKKSQQIQNNNNLRKEIVEIQHTIKY